MQRAHQWSLSDDLGTWYRITGGGLGANRGGAEGRERIRGHAAFEPAVPASWSLLRRWSG